MSKSGIPYFPLDVSLDTSFELVEAEFGIVGFGVIIKVFQLIYSEGGYYVEWNDEVTLLFSKKNGLGCNVVSEIIQSAIRRGIFSDEIFQQYKVLTSRGIQERYVKATSRRKEVEIKSQYLLLCNTQIPTNVYISGENANIFSKNADIFKQSKVKESKVKESRVKESRVEEDNPAGNNADQCKQSVNLLETIKGAPLSGYEIERTVDFVKTYGEELVLAAYKEMGDCNAFSIRYAERILEDWRQHGRRKDKAGGKSKAGKPTSPTIMTNDTDYSDIYSINE